MTVPARRLSPFSLLSAWSLALAAALWLRWGLYQGFQQPWQGPGLLWLLLLLGASAWAVVEEPRLGASGPWGLAPWLGLALGLGVGQGLLYYDVQGKDALAALGFGLLLTGAAFAFMPGWGRRLAFACGAALSVLGVGTLATRSGIAWDLFVGPWKGQPLMLLLWLLLAAGVLGLAWQARREPALQHAPPLSRRQEAWGLLGILVLGAALRFYRAGQLPAGWWYDEVNLARAIQDLVLDPGRAPLYVGQQVENPGAWLWIGAAFFKAFGVRLSVLRVATGVFGLLAVLPFWGLARLWLGSRWALLAALLYACSRWTLIPQRIAFMSGFALFVALAAFWALWSARLRPGLWRWLVAGLLLGANLHTYTPGRFVPLIAAVFLAGEALLDRSWRLPWRAWALLLVGFLLSAGPMLWYIAHHGSEYAMRAAQVSIFTDVKASGRPLIPELWGSMAKHLLMFNYRGDFNARHNLHFMPHVDFITACALAPALPWALGRAWSDARARFLIVWLAFMLAAGAFTMPVEAPQGHRTILAAPALFLALGLAWPAFLQRLRSALDGHWPLSLRLMGGVLLAGAVFFNGWELLAVWPRAEATFRSFSPGASEVLRRIQSTGPGTVVAVSSLPAEYQFNGFEWGVFSRFALRQRGGRWMDLRPGLSVPARDGDAPTRSVLLLWGESDAAIGQALATGYPDLPIHAVPQPFPAAGEPTVLLDWMEIPYERLPSREAAGPGALLWRAEP